ncbi:MAG: histidine triad nucleotide-binding protein [Actinobacteria bacterium HGW-Actinobacteria-7]|jgi:histidine triad (HIT) family protein|nr:MAG: histidine triad nucleotide-binding protein [Actinobacteria bacterium HGW-Actinobacteria-7]
MSDCIFCNIVSGEIPATVVYEDDQVLAFDDLSPQAPVHTLVIPKAHFSSLADDVDTATLGAVFTAVRAVAVLKGIDQSGYRTIVNSGPDSMQTVEHLHVHVMGGRKMAHGMVVFSGD